MFCSHAEFVKNINKETIAANVAKTRPKFRSQNLSCSFLSFDNEFLAALPKTKTNEYIDQVIKTTRIVIWAAKASCCNCNISDC